MSPSIYGPFRSQSHLNTDQALLFSLSLFFFSFLKPKLNSHWRMSLLRQFFLTGLNNWCNSSGQLEIFIVILNSFITFTVLPEACKRDLPFWLHSVTQRVISQKKQLLSTLSITFYLHQGLFHHNTRCFMPFQSSIISKLSPLILIWNEVLSFKWQFFTFAVRRSLEHFMQWLVLNKVLKTLWKAKECYNDFILLDNIIDLFDNTHRQYVDMFLSHFKYTRTQEMSS